MIVRWILRRLGLLRPPPEVAEVFEELRIHREAADRETRRLQREGIGPWEASLFGEPYPPRRPLERRHAP